MKETSRTSWISNVALLATALVAAYVIIALTNENRELRALLSAKQGSPLDSSYAAGDALPALQLLRANGGTASLDALYEHGGVVVFLTTTCPYCLETLPVWSQLAVDLEAAAVPFHGVSFHDGELTDAYAREHGLEWPLWVLEDVGASSSVRVASVPFTMLVGPGAVVQEVWLGPLQAPDLDRLRAAAITRTIP